MPEVNFDLNEDVVEIINEPPKWIIRNGLLVLFILICGMLILMNYIKYNESIDLDLTLKINPSEYFKTTINNGNSVLQNFDDKMEVRKGDTVCIEKAKFNSIKYIISPINGSIYYTLDINSLNKTLIIIPKKMFPNIYTYVSVSERKKIKTGMTVYLEHYGNSKDEELEGVVAKVFSIPTRNNFLVEIKLKSLLSSENIYILSQSKIKGKIIINNRTLFSKIFNFL